MKVCMIFEGSYPYVHGGISSWAHNLFKDLPDVEFVLWCIGAKEEDRGNFKYELLPHVSAVHEVFLDTALKLTHSKRYRDSAFSQKERESLMNLFAAQKVDWDVLFELFQKRHINPADLMISDIFTDLLMRDCEEYYPNVSFTDYFYTVRSIVLPILYLIGQKVPEADVYHSVSTGYAGALGSLASWKTKKPFLLTEHGIYTREREEELIRADWLVPRFRSLWIDFFYTLSDCAYTHASRITSLFQGASRIQHEIGADKAKQLIIPNGIHEERFEKVPEKEASEDEIIIGAVVRIARIKDLKTMIYAFIEAEQMLEVAKLYILGDTDDEEYREECTRVVKQLGFEDRIIFTGIVDVMPYLEMFDFTLLTSISEGQPLCILESLAAGRPCIATDVGCCRELLLADDGLGVAGMIVPPMNSTLLARAIVLMGGDPYLRQTMGENGKARVKNYYTNQKMVNSYKKMYEEAWQESDSN